MSENMKDPILPIAFPKLKSVGETGDWAVDQPVIDYHKCTNCGICLVVCPEGAIKIDSEDEKQFPVIDYSVCKGCYLCKHECGPSAMENRRSVYTGNNK